MKMDLRGFVYALEPVQRKCQWQLDGLLQKISALQKQIEAAQTEVEVMRQEHENVAKSANALLQMRMDVNLHQHALSYMGKLNNQIKTLQGTLIFLMDTRSDLREKCIQQQRKLELIDQHRETSLKEYVSIMEAQQNAEADKDWNARSFLRTNGQKCDVQIEVCRAEERV